MTAIGDHAKTNIYIQCTHLTSLADKKEKCVFEAHLNGCKWCAKVTQSGPIYSSHAFSLTTCKKLKWHTHTLCKHKVDHYCSLWAIEINKNPQGNCSKDRELLKDCSHVYFVHTQGCISFVNSIICIHICKDSVNLIVLWLGTMGRTQFYDSLHRPPQA